MVRFLRVLANIAMVLTAVVVLLVVVITISNKLEQRKMDEFEKKIKERAPIGRPHDVYRRDLLTDLKFDEVKDWDEAEIIPGGRLVRGIRFRYAGKITWDEGPIMYDIITEAEFDDQKSLRSLKIWRRGNGF